MSKYKISRNEAGEISVDYRYFSTDESVEKVLAVIPVWIYNDCPFAVGGQISSMAGASNLALTILVHYLGEWPVHVQEELSGHNSGFRSHALKFFRGFREDIIAEIGEIPKGECWSLEGESIYQWLESHIAAQKT